MKDSNYSLDFLKYSSHKLNCPRCKKLIYNRDREKLYEELNKHLEDCKKNGHKISGEKNN